MNTVIGNFVSSVPALVAAMSAMDNDLQLANKKAADLQAQLDNSAPIVFDLLERSAWLIASGTAANTNAVGNTATSQQTLPGLNYATRTIIPDGSYADKYWFKQLGANKDVRRFKYQGSYLFPSMADAYNSQAVEVDFDKADDIALPVYNCGAQFDFAENMFRVWNKSIGSWVPTGLTMPRYAYATWVDFEMNFHHDNDAVYYDSLKINGSNLVIPSLIFPAPLLQKGPHMNVGFQLDGNKLSKAYSVAIDRFKLYCWKA